MGKRCIVLLLNELRSINRPKSIYMLPHPSTPLRELLLSSTLSGVEGYENVAPFNIPILLGQLIVIVLYMISEYNGLIISKYLALLE